VPIAQSLLGGKPSAGGGVVTTNRTDDNRAEGVRCGFFSFYDAGFDLSG
jgi:hypothetical protein